MGNNSSHVKLVNQTDFAMRYHIGHSMSTMSPHGFSEPYVGRHREPLTLLLSAFGAEGSLTIAITVKVGTEYTITRDTFNSLATVVQLGVERDQKRQKDPVSLRALAHKGSPWLSALSTDSPDYITMTFVDKTDYDCTFFYLERAGMQFRLSAPSVVRSHVSQGSVTLCASAYGHYGTNEFPCDADVSICDSNLGREYVREGAYRRDWNAGMDLKYQEVHVQNTTKYKIWIRAGGNPHGLGSCKPLTAPMRDGAFDMLISATGKQGAAFRWITAPADKTFKITKETFGNGRHSLGRAMSGCAQGSPLAQHSQFRIVSPGS